MQGFARNQIGQIACIACLSNLITFQVPQRLCMAQSQATAVTQDHEVGPLNSTLTFRISPVCFARLQAQSLVRQCGYGTLARHWLIQGAKAEGIDLTAVL